jgi:hypothetical protein
VIAVLLAGLLALTACAEGGEDTGDAAPTPGGTVSTSPPSLPSPSAGPSGELILTGVVEEGVELGCLILRANGEPYLLLGGDRAIITAGRRIIVRGRPDPGLVTTCQQGTPFVVAEVRAA